MNQWDEAAIWEELVEGHYDGAEAYCAIRELADDLDARYGLQIDAAARGTIFVGHLDRW